MAGRGAGSDCPVYVVTLTQLYQPYVAALLSELEIGFSGIYFYWGRYSITLSGLGRSSGVLLRFVFVSDSGVETQGVAIDRVQITPSNFLRYSEMTYSITMSRQQNSLEYKS